MDAWGGEEIAYWAEGGGEKGTGGGVVTGTPVPDVSGDICRGN